MSEFESLKPFSNSRTSLQSTCCSVCYSSNSGKYKCPRCAVRTCSVLCFKSHKASEKCLQSERWKKINAHSQFNDAVSIDDQQFMQKIGDKVKAVKDEFVPKEQNKSLTEEEKPSTQIHLSAGQRFLLQNAHLRRIWLHLDDAHNASGSQYERFSDTIFWTCSVKFVCRAFPAVRESSQNLAPSTDVDAEHSNSSLSPAALTSVSKPIVDYNGSDDDEYFDVTKPASCQIQVDRQENGICVESDNSDRCSESSTGEDSQQMQLECIECSESSTGEDSQQMQLECIDYTVEKIPESIRVVTLLRQFLRPKLYGPVITRSQIDITKMEQFIGAFDSLLSTSFSNYFNKESSNKLLVYLEVPMNNNQKEEKTQDEQEARYYTVDPNRTILDNLRNRHVNGHPCFVVVLRRDTEFGELELPLMGEEEQKQMQEKNKEEGRTFNERPKWQQKHFGKMDRRNFNWRNRRGMSKGNPRHTHQQQWNLSDVGNAWAQNQRQNSFAAPVVNCQNVNPAAFHPYQRQPIFNQNMQFSGPFMQQPMGGGWNVNGNHYNYNRRKFHQ